MTQSKKKYSSFNLFIRSLLFLILSVSSICLFSTFCVVSLLFLSLKQRFYLIQKFLGFNIYLLKKICLIDYEVEGLENIPKDRIGIILSKHQSTWETFFLPLFFNNPAIISKREILWIPFFGWGLATAKPIIIDRKKRFLSMQQIYIKGKQSLEEGRWILIFPEGTRIPPGKIGRYKLGGARLAAETGYPILPIAVNSGRYWGRRQFIKQPGTIKVVIGPLIESKGRTPEELLYLTKYWIEKTMVRIDCLVDESTS